MTREEAKQVLIVKAGLGSFVENIIDQIYDDHYDIVKAKDDEIKKLKEQYHQCLDDYIKCAERNSK